MIVRMVPFGEQEWRFLRLHSLSTDPVLVLSSDLGLCDTNDRLQPLALYSTVIIK